MSEVQKKKVIVGISGGGRSLKNLYERTQTGVYPFEIMGVISSNPTCAGNELARKFRLPLFIGDFSAKHRSETSIKMAEWIEESSADLIALAGFLKPFPLDHKLGDQIINIHPSLLPKFGGPGMYGKRVHEAVVAAGEEFSGATIHAVTEKYDEGPIIAQVSVKVPSSDPQELADEVFKAECELYPEVLRLISEGKLNLRPREIYHLVQDHGGDA